MHVNKDNNSYVKKLAGKLECDTATEEDLKTAKRTIELYFIVGLTNEVDESVRRFNVMFGIDDDEGNRTKCMYEYFGHKENSVVKKDNSNPHPKVSRFSDEGFLLSFVTSYTITSIHRLNRMTQDINS